MSDIRYDELKRGTSVIFARILPNIGYYELLNLSIVSKYNDYCTGVDKKTKQTFLFTKSDAEERLFFDKKLASVYLKEKRIENKDIKIVTE